MDLLASRKASCVSRTSPGLSSIKSTSMGIPSPPMTFFISSHFLQGQKRYVEPCPGLDLTGILLTCPLWTGASGEIQSILDSEQGLDRLNAHAVRPCCGRVALVIQKSLTPLSNLSNALNSTGLLR